MKILTFLIQGSALLVAVLLIRALAGKKLNPYIRYGLWLLVAVRLLIPVSIPAPFGTMYTGDSMTADDEIGNVYPSDTVVSGEGLESQGSAEELPAPGNMSPYQHPTYRVMRSGSSGRNLWPQLALWIRRIWAAGAVLVALILLTERAAFERRMKRMRKPLVMNCSGVSHKLPVYLVKHLESPCLAGFLKPVIYVNETELEQERLSMAVCHEEVHYAHGDLLWAFVRGVLVSLYWFHPLVWVAALLSARDGELACDRGTMERLGESKRTAYGQLLLAHTAPSPGRHHLAFPYSVSLSSGGREMKKRLEQITGAARPGAKVSVVVLVLAAFLTGCAFLSAEGEESTETGQTPDTGAASASEENGLSGQQKELDALDAALREKQEEVDALDAALKEEQERVTGGQVELEAAAASYTSDTPLGVDGPMLDYVGEVDGSCRIIFHDYFGLLVYNVSEGIVEYSLDLAPIGCQYTQGDNACVVRVSSDGRTVYLNNPADGGSLYRYEIAENKLYKEAADVSLDDMEDLYNDYLWEEKPPEADYWISNKVIADPEGYKAGVDYDCTADLYIPEGMNDTVGNLRLRITDMVHILFPTPSE